MDQGRFFSDFEDRHHAPVAVIGADVVKGLFGGENPIGKKINSDGLELEVVGTMHRPSASFFDQSDNRVFLPFSSMMKKYPNARDMALIVTAEWQVRYAFFVHPLAVAAWRFVWAGSTAGCRRRTVPATSRRRWSGRSEPAPAGS